MAAAIAGLTAPPLFAATCPLAPAEYQGYRVNEVQITSPLRFLHPGDFGRNALDQTIPLRSGASFNLVRFNQGPATIASVLRRRGNGTALRIVAVAGTLENCDKDTRQLDVRYIVFSAALPPGAYGFEEREQASEHPAAIASRLGDDKRSLAIPLFGYNGTRGLFGGVEYDIHAFHLETAVSSKSLTGAMRMAEGPWRWSAVYRDVPATEVKLIRSSLGAGYFNSWKFLRYAVSLEGGRETTGTPAWYGALKMLAGVNGAQNSSAWAAAYGFEIGRSLSVPAGQWAKHIVDVGYTGSFLPMPRNQQERAAFIGRPHHPVTLEARLGAGVLQAAGYLPAGERFFGGNRALPFIESAAWDVRGQAYLRSIPENGLGGAGGTRFYSLNLTLGKALYGRPLLPKDLGTPEFVNNMDFALNTAKGELSDTYLAKEPGLQKANSAIPAIEAALGALKAEMAKWPAEAESAPLYSDLGRALRTTKAIDNGSSLVPVLAGTILAQVDADLVAVRGRLAPDDAARMDALRRKIADGRKALAEAVSGPEAKAARAHADRRAGEDLSAAEGVLNALLYELNIYSIAPVAMFDVARVWPSNSRVCYAAGGGLRLSLIHLNLTTGYAVNIRRSDGQPLGAVFVQFDVSNVWH